jgi:hypothetical protein
MPSERDMHRNKPFMANDTAQGHLVNVMGHHRETLIRMALDMAPDTVMVMGATGAVNVTEEEGLRYLS